MSVGNLLPCKWDFIIQNMPAHYKCSHLCIAHSCTCPKSYQHVVLTDIPKLQQRCIVHTTFKILPPMSRDTHNLHIQQKLSTWLETTTNTSLQLLHILYCTCDTLNILRYNIMEMLKLAPQFIPCFVCCFCDFHFLFIRY